MRGTEKRGYDIGMTLPQRVKRYTPQEYYRLEQEAEGKSDYYDGQIFAMAGGTVAHSRIAINLGHELEARFEGGPCRTQNSDLRLKVAATGLRTYPDITVYCSEIQMDPEDSSNTTAVNPTAIFEVLSRSTEAYDRGFKFDNYREIESLKAFVLVSQTHPQVEIYERNGDAWEFRTFKGMDGVLKIPPVRIEIPLARIYRNVEFEPTLRPFDG
jgi:Uma2 family endonuclease